MCGSKETLQVKETDLLFCYGTPFCVPQIAHHISHLLAKKVANQVLIAGGFTFDGLPFIEKKSESRLIYEHIPSVFTDVNFLLEEKSLIFYDLSSDTSHRQTVSLDK